MKTILKFALFLFILTFHLTTTAQELQLSNNVCGRTIQSIGSNILTNVNRGFGHRYEVTRMDGTIIGVYDAIAASNQFPARSRYLFRFSFLTGFPWSFNSSYRVRVAAFDGVNWSGYGPYCQVNTPSNELSISSSICGTQISSLGSNIITNSNHNAGHRFEIRELSGELVGVYDGIQTAEQFPSRSPYIFRFSWMPTELISEGRTYSIRVSSFDAISGIWLNYGPSCNVKTPGLQETSLASDFCGNLTLDSNDVHISAMPVSGAAEYLFNVKDGLNNVGNLISNTPTVNLKDLGNNLPLAGKVYNISVATRRNSNIGFSDLGQSCEVAVMGFTTKMREEYCGKVYNYLLEDSLFAETIEQAQAYRFRIRNGEFQSIDTISIPSTNGYINLSKFSGIEYCKDYELSVSVMVNGIWNNFGEPCIVTTVCHPTTTLRPAFFNDTITSCMTNLFSRTILQSEGVQFEVRGNGFSEVVNASAHNRFRFTDLINIGRVTYETNYTVRCRIFMNGVWGQWGESCTVYLKTNSRISNVCNDTLSSMTNNVSATAVGCAQDYRFLVNGPGLNNTIVNLPNFSNSFRFNLVPGAQMGSTYSVRVSVLVNGQWSPYGEECFVTTPSPTKSLTESELNNDLITVFPNPSNQFFNVQFDNTYVGEYKIVNLNGQVIEVSSFEGNQIILGDNLEEGIYFIFLESEGKLIAKERLVKVN